MKGNDTKHARHHETNKSNVELSTAILTEEGLKINTGLRYLVRYSVAVDNAPYCMTDKVDSWVKSVELFSWITEKEPQAAFTGLNRPLKHFLA